MKSIKKIISLVLTVVLIVGAFSLISNISSSEKTNIQSYEFSRGGLKDTGKYEDADNKIYTKEAFSCKGLEIEIDFEANCTYQIFYYDADEMFLTKTEKLSTKTYVMEEDSSIEEYRSEIRLARVVVTIELADDDRKIDLWEIFGHASKVKISVSKNQKFPESAEEGEVVATEVTE